MDKTTVYDVIKYKSLYTSFYENNNIYYIRGYYREMRIVFNDNTDLWVNYEEVKNLPIKLLTISASTAFIERFFQFVA